MKQPTAHFTLSNDRSLADINVTGSFEPEQLELLLHELIALRANMQPPVGTLAQALEAGSHVLAQADPSWKAMPLKKGGMRLLVSNAGLGWLSFDMPESGVAFLRDLLNANASSVTEKPADLQ